MLDSQTTKRVGSGQEISKSRSMAPRRKEHVLGFFGESRLGLRCMIGPVGGSWIRKWAYYCFLVWVISERENAIIQAIHRIWFLILYQIQSDPTNYLPQKTHLLHLI